MRYESKNVRDSANASKLTSEATVGSSQCRSTDLNHWGLERRLERKNKVACKAAESFLNLLRPGLERILAVPQTINVSGAERTGRVYQRMRSANELTADLLLWSRNVTFLRHIRYRLNILPLCLGISCGTTSTTRFGIAVTRFGHFGFFLTHDICVTGMPD
jgi:hypothetical protein